MGFCFWRDSWKFSQCIKELHSFIEPRTGKESSLISDEVYQFVIQNKESLDGAVVQERDFDFDYFGFKNRIPTYVEVKNDRIRQKYLMQIMRYYCECNQEHYNFNFFVICQKKIRPHRGKILDKLGIVILDIKDVCSEGLDSWM